MWRDSPSITGFRSYSGGDAVLRTEGDVLKMSVRSFRPFLVVFACLFLPAFAVAAWFMISEPGLRLALTIGGPIVGAITFAMVYALLSYHEGLGKYLIIDRAAKIVSLPRLKKEFSFAQVVGFQWIRGRTRQYADVEVDLNLLVSEFGEVVRYHVMGNPSRRMVEQVLCFSGLSLEEIDLGWRGDRDTDKATAGT